MTLEASPDRTDDIIKQVSALAAKSVMVGVTSDTAARDDALSNADLGFIHEFGAPAANIPARPFLAPGIEGAQDAVNAAMRRAANAALDGRPDQVDQALHRAGVAAQTGAKNRMRTGEFEQLKDSTIANRFRGRKTKGKRAGEKLYSGLRDEGVSAADAQGLANIRPLINSAQLLNSITYAIREG